MNTFLSCLRTVLLWIQSTLSVVELDLGPVVAFIMFSGFKFLQYLIALTLRYFNEFKLFMIKFKNLIGLRDPDLSVFHLPQPLTCILYVL